MAFLCVQQRCFVKNGEVRLCELLENRYVEDMKKACSYGIDLVLVLGFLTVFSKNAISLMYHEVAGLALLILCLIHLAMHAPWVRSVFSRLFQRGTSAKIRFMAFVDAALVLGTILLLVSGLMVSKKLFPHAGGEFMIPVHFFAAALFLILIGLHLGLHSERICRPARLSVAKWRCLCVLLVALIVLAIFAMATSSFKTWISVPFVQAEAHAHGAAGGPQRGMAQGFSFARFCMVTGTTLAIMAGWASLAALPVLHHVRKVSRR